MCLAVFGLAAHPHYSLVIAANRDEFHGRPAAAAHWWPEGWLAGRDLSGGGTWLGIARNGHWALLTNVREPERRDPLAPTRGALVTRVLADPREPMAALADIAMDMAGFNGFNLVAGTPAAAHWLSNRAGGPHPLPDPIHTVSNAALDTPWPKAVATRQGLEEWCRAGERDVEPLFETLASRAIASDDVLPSTGVPLERERRLSARFIVMPDYGTRCSTVILVGRDGRVRFEERSFDREGKPAGEASFRFRLE